MKRICTLLLAALVCVGGFSVGAYAAEEPLTPEGNLTLVDDIIADKQFITVVSKGGNYFYIIIDNAAEGENTVHFLNQVDEADLLALMDEEQIESLGSVVTCICTDKCLAGAVNTDCPPCTVNMTECTGKEPIPIVTATPDAPVEATPEPEESGISITNIAILTLFVAVLAGGAAYGFKSLKSRSKTKPAADFDDYDYYDEPEEADDDDER